MCSTFLLPDIVDAAFPSLHDEALPLLLNDLVNLELLANNSSGC